MVINRKFGEKKFFGRNSKNRFFQKLFFGNPTREQFPKDHMIKYNVKQTAFGTWKFFR